MAADPPEDRRRLDPAVVWREAKELLWARRGRLTLALALLLGSRFAGLVLPASSKFVVDQVIGERRADLLPLLATVVVAASLLQAALSYVLRVVIGVAAQRSIAELRRKVQKHVGQLPIRFFDDRKSGELISRVMNDAEGIRSLVGGGFIELIGALCTAALAATVLLWINWRMTVVTLVLITLFLAAMLLSVRRLRPLFRERGRITAEITARLAEVFGGIRVVKAYTAEKREERRFATGIHQLLRNVVRTVRGIATMTSLFSLIFGLTGAAMAWVGAREVLAERMSLGDLFMYLVFTGFVVSPLLQLTGLAPQVIEAFAGLDRIRELLREPTETETSGDRRLGRLHGAVEFRDVHFAYRPERPVLHGISFDAPAGSTTALVGPSGAGKSTLIRLILAFDHPTSGEIRVDALDLATLHLWDYRRQLGIVLQESFLFDGTIRDNIAYSWPAASDEAIATAARIACCDELVASFPDGYDTVIGERGIKLSGGQRQRLAIARAVLADPRILVLDEATSSLDSESEDRIQAGLGALREGRTTFVIAHRLSTVVNADQILVLDEGRITERGCHDELVASGGLYARLYEKQVRREASWFLNPGEEIGAAEPRPPRTSTEVAPELPFSLPLGLGRGRE